jgi:hypothetical protein
MVLFVGTRYQHIFDTIYILLKRYFQHVITPFGSLRARLFDCNVHANQLRIATAPPKPPGMMPSQQGHCRADA